MSVLYIGQEYSMGKLLISHDAMHTLLGHLQVFPPFYDILHEFGERIERPSESRGCFQEWKLAPSQSFELCYLFKFVEEHGRDYEEGSWSIRQTAVYHRRDTETGKDFVVILNPSRAFQQRWRQATQDEKTKPGAGDLHTLLMSCASSKWNLFVNGLEDQFEPLKTKTHLSRVQPSKENSFPDLHYDDFQDVQVMRDRLHRLSHLLESNLAICQKIARKALGKPALTWINNTHEPTVNGECIKMSYSEMKLQKRRVQTLLRRLDAVAGSMQSTLAFRGLEALYSSGKASAELTHLAQADNRLMLRLTQEAQRDARTLKTITIVTMVYLPASFASQMLSMGYISISRTPNRIAFHFDGELVIFGCLTIFFLIATFTAWWCADRRHPKCLGHSAPSVLARMDEEAGIGINVQ
ncbi:hypothetical protein EV356DRAFT_323727 [Viridothelium virens]|uniref:CorA-like transporter domain-containing protein n=1 Tax=Viridothelium virens TaxID=1048519 RepID=A0A6A6GYE1_VIRVR|nr:hypothetical protein EV356DRAFT_323727 [Viridothelium virens]